jgi:hypothetical protein
MSGQDTKEVVKRDHLVFETQSVVPYEVYETNIYVFSDTGDFQDSSPKESVYTKFILYNST